MFQVSSKRFLGIGRRQWRWRFVAGNGRIIAMSSESYINREDCIDSIYLVRNPDAPVNIEDE